MTIIEDGLEEGKQLLDQHEVSEFSSRIRETQFRKHFQTSIRNRGPHYEQKIQFIIRYKICLTRIMTSHECYELFRNIAFVRISALILF